MTAKVNTYMTIFDKKKGIVNLLKGIETGDPDSVKVVNEAKYIQHNPQTEEGSEGLAELFKRLSKTSPRVNIVRIFEDGDFVFAHTEYDFANRNIGFEIFRFENDQTVEHWDNIQRRKGPNTSGHSMVDGETNVKQPKDTEVNRALIKQFVKEILIGINQKPISNFLNLEDFAEHSPEYNDDFSHVSNSLSNKTIKYIKCHRILADGNFVLSVCEGVKDKKSTSFFDLYRLNKERIVEHWSTTESIAPKSEWKNNNGKF